MQRLPRSAYCRRYIRCRSSCGANAARIIASFVRIYVTRASQLSPRTVGADEERRRRQPPKCKKPNGSCLQTSSRGAAHSGETNADPHGLPLVGTGILQPVRFSKQNPSYERQATRRTVEGSHASRWSVTKFNQKGGQQQIAPRLQGSFLNQKYVVKKEDDGSNRCPPILFSSSFCSSRALERRVLSPDTHGRTSRGSARRFRLLAFVRRLYSNRTSSSSRLSHSTRQRAL